MGRGGPVEKDCTHIFFWPLEDRRYALLCLPLGRPSHGLKTQSRQIVIMHDSRSVDLADQVHKRTAGQAYFVVECLNSLVRDSIVTYSSENCRYTWDAGEIYLIQTGDSVAQLIAKNLNSLPQESLLILQILSCFGIQTDDTLLNILEGYQTSLISSIDSFCERGVLDRAGPIGKHRMIQSNLFMRHFYNPIIHCPPSWNTFSLILYQL